MDKTNSENDLHRNVVGLPDLNTSSNVITIGMRAPDFIADSTFGVTKMSDYYGKWVVLFSHPRRFYTCMYY